MIVYLSGGSSIVETHVQDPTIMLSFWVNVSHKKNNPDRRLRDLLAARKVYPKTLKPKGKTCPKEIVIRKTPRKKRRHQKP